MSTLAAQAYRGLYNRKPKKRLAVKYSGRMKHFNAHVTSTPELMTFTLSKEYLELGDEIRIGVMQHLLTRLNKRRGVKPKHSLEMDLYDKFLKNIGEYQSAGGGTIEDEELQESFDRVNKEYFDDYLIPPSIRWGGNSKSHLGHYSFADDTITMSRALRDSGEFLNYVLYHELLHKKHKFEHRNGRTHSHTPAFRKDERKFRMSDGREPEKALTSYLRGLRRPSTRRKKTPMQRLLEYF